MKYKFLLSLCLAGASFGVFAQTHQEGVEYYRAGQYNNALELLERNFNNPGTDKAVANYYLGLLSVKQKDLNQALKYFNDGVAANPEYPYNYIGLGSLELKNGNIKEAEKLFKQAEKFNKKDAAVEVAIARAYYDTPDGAVKYAKQIDKAMNNARKRNMYEPEIFIFEGDIANDKGDINDAASAYEMATTYNDKSADAYVKYAELYTKFNPDYAIAMLQKLLQNNPQSALGQRELAKAYENKKDYKNAAIQYGNYVNNPNHFKSDEVQYSLLLFFDSNFKKGYEYASELLAKDPANFTARRFQFMNAAQMPELAEQLLPMAENLYADHKADPKKNGLAAIDYNLMVPELIKAKKYDEATEVLNEALKDDPNNAGFLKLAANIPLEQGDYAKAADMYADMIKRTNSDSFNDALQTALLYFYAGSGDNNNPTYLNNAITFAQKALAINGEQYRPYKVMGDAKILLAPKAEQGNAAKEDYTKALQYIDKEKYAKDYEFMNNYVGNK